MFILSKIMIFHGHRRIETFCREPLAVGEMLWILIGPFTMDISARYLLPLTTPLSSPKKIPALGFGNRYLSIPRHSVADPDQTYCSKEEIEEYKNKDPINSRDKLINEGILSNETANDLDQAAKDEAEASAEFALASPFPEVSELMDDVYWETDNPEEKVSSGTMFLKLLAS